MRPSTLQWHRDTYILSAGDVAIGILTRGFTPSGIKHNEGALPISTREIWEVHQVQVYVNNAAGKNKRGVQVGLGISAENPGSYVNLPTDPPDGISGAMAGVRYVGAPFLTTHGVSWGLVTPGFVATDRVITWILYRVLEDME